MRNAHGAIVKNPSKSCNSYQLHRLRYGVEELLTNMRTAQSSMLLRFPGRSENQAISKRVKGKGAMRV